MALASYDKLALRWQPNRGDNRVFTLLVTVVLVLALLLGILLSSIQVPPKTEQERQVVPERVARFISQQEKPKPVEPPRPPPPPPEVRQPEPRPEPERPQVQRERPRETPQPLTESQQQARERAARSGLLAHMAEMNSLIDTPEVSAQVRANIERRGETQAAGHDASVLTAGATRGSGGVDDARFATQAGTTELSQADVSAARDALAASDGALAASAAQAATASQARTRSQEEITLVFDRHKSQLQNTYNRARRNNPALRGRLVLRITIQPDGSVSAIDVVSSELTDQSLVSSLVARVRSFQFGAKDVDAVTVNYPIEFLPN